MVSISLSRFSALMIVPMFMASLVLGSNTVFFDTFDITYKNDGRGYTVHSDKIMTIHVSNNYMTMTSTSNYLSDVSASQSFTIESYKFNVNDLETRFNQQAEQITKFKENHQLSDDNIVDVFKKMGSNVERKLLAIALKGTGSINYKTFAAILGSFSDSDCGKTVLLSLFSHVIVKVKEERKAVLELVLTHSLSDTELIKFYEAYHMKVENIESWEQRAIYERISSDSSKTSFLSLTSQHTDDFFSDPCFYIESISSDSSVINAIQILKDKKLSSDNATRIIGKISSDSSKVKAINLLHLSSLSSEGLVGVFYGISSDSSKVDGLRAVHHRINSGDHAQQIINGISSDSKKVEGIKLLLNIGYEPHHLNSMVSAISSDSSKVEAIRAMKGLIATGEQAVQIIRSISSDSTTVQAIGILSDKPYNNGHIVSLIHKISSDSSKVKAIELLCAKIIDVETAKTLLRNISSDSSKVSAVNVLFGNKRIAITASDVKTISQIPSSSSSKLTIQSFLLDNL